MKYLHANCGAIKDSHCDNNVIHTVIYNVNDAEKALGLLCVVSAVLNDDTFFRRTTLLQQQ